MKYSGTDKGNVNKKTHTNCKREREQKIAGRELERKQHNKVLASRDNILFVW